MRLVDNLTFDRASTLVFRAIPFHVPDLTSELIRSLPEIPFQQLTLPMVMPQYANLDIDFWLHQGKLGFAETSVCLFHEETHLGTPILNALHELQSGTCPAQLTITFARHERRSALSALRLKYVPARQELRIMSIQQEGKSATIEMTTEGLSLLISAVGSWLEGAEDFGVSPTHSKVKPNELGRLDHSSGELWFWGPGYTGP